MCVLSMILRGGLLINEYLQEATYKLKVFMKNLRGMRI